MLNRIFLSADIEGTCGIAHWDETELGKPDYEPFRHQMTAKSPPPAKAHSPQAVKTCSSRMRTTARAT